MTITARSYRARDRGRKACGLTLAILWLDSFANQPVSMDPVLTAMARMAEQDQDWRQPIIVWLPSGKFSGDICSAAQWFRFMGAANRATIEPTKGETEAAIAAQGWSDLSAGYETLADDPEWEPKYLHLVDAVEHIETAGPMGVFSRTIQFPYLRVPMGVIDTYVFARQST